ncbi:MAG: RAD55 family ATPase [Nitrososphaerales archaeon]
MQERIKTGIPGLDTMLMGGFMERDAVLIAGNAGAGKTTLALQYLVNGVNQYDQPGLYVTFEEVPDQIYRDALSFGWDLKKLEDAGKLKIICTSPELLIVSDQGGENLLDDTIRELQPRRIVIDSLSHIGMYLEEKNFRREAYRLMRYLKIKGLSSLLLWEVTQSGGQGVSISDIGISFLSDAVVLLRPVEINSSMRKAIAILKLRGSDHDKDLREYEITSTGIKIVAPFSDYEGIMSGSARRIDRLSGEDLYRRGLIKKDEKRK